ncbi:WxL protein peptidoglycan domain-containing protein [Streptomyces sp. NPDC091292]|uniref:WxL protein peptidoglycan domain-containing protein n=1 Tax=Streptomyces sp. NPDC091292 TaxID=3365991 RepID=UPI0038227211
MQAPLAPRRITVTALVRTVVLALLTALALTTLPAGPAHAATGDVTWTVRTAPNDYGADRSSFSHAVNPGGQIKDAMVVANRGKDPLTLAVYAADGYTTGTGQLDLLTRDKKSVGVGAWLHADRASVVVRPGKTVTVPFTITVPDNATPGDHVGGILTSLKQPDDEKGINVDRRLGIRVKLRVSGEVKPSLKVENLKVAYEGKLTPFASGDATLTYTIHNTGNVALSATQKGSVAGPFGWFEKAAGAISPPPELLPGESWKMRVPVKGVTPAFTLTATTTLTPVLTDASGSTSSLPPVEATATGWAVPWTLLVLALLLIAAATTTTLLTRRNRRRRKEREDTRVREAVEEALSTGKS